MIYLQQQQTNLMDSVFIQKKSEYLVQPNDMLFIRVSSINEEINKIYNSSYQTTNTNYAYNSASLYLTSFSINDSGYVSLPIIGDMKVSNLSVLSIERLIQKRVDEFLNGAIVSVKLMTFPICVLGEVNNPGLYENYNNNLTIFEALGKASDLTIYGNRKNILIIRQTEEGNTTKRIDITDINLLASEYYYLRPNDIIYVEPMKYKAFKLNSPNISILLSGVTTLIVVLNFLNK
ncbi:MAG: hypothetical protein A2W91_15520 [Bacteroidetes bacterium GWF2_38_335]|nr:MAG: hypothetical protein A2W91_15520 [Bacteroidetes bacterium GWF2_38_335]OFY81533.1 MAG: hypothetical protein A2281_11380 [Bacteroidetes bacterium RIFOXYA12_FULL_38_20]